MKQLYSPEAFQRLKGTYGALDDEFRQHEPHLRELANYLLPRRYEWLKSGSLGGAMIANQSRSARARSEFILDPAGTVAIMTLAAGMLDGITSPARQWLRLGQAGVAKDYVPPKDHQLYFEECERRMLLALAGTNFYSSMAMLYTDLCGFGTGAMLIYEDYDSIFRFYNSPVGEFRIGTDARGIVNTFGRQIVFTVRQLVERFGIENLSPPLQEKAKRGGKALHHKVLVTHLIEPNDQGREESISSTFASREFYWETNMNAGKMLSVSGYTEPQGVFPRWEVTGQDNYGTGPGTKALPEIIQLQHETLRRAQALDKSVDPPMLFESFMNGADTSMLPGARNYAPPGASFGAKPLISAGQFPFHELDQNRSELRGRIAEICHNDLFRMISNLDTVRSATEIDARREEKLVLMGPVLNRFENEALDPIIRRVYGIMRRKGLLPTPPQDLEEADIEVRYVSILSDAQQAVGTVTTERFLQVVGDVAAIDPKVLAAVDFVALIRDYGRRLNITADGLRSEEEVQAQLSAEEDMTAQREAAVIGKELAQGAAQLASVDVGGGAEAAQMLLGG